MNNYCGNCCFERRFLKEVILAYCGTTESIDIGKPSEPVEPLPPDLELPEEPELPPEH